MAPTMAKEKPGGSAHNAAVLDRLRSLRGPGESYTDVILRLASKELSMRARGGVMSGRRPLIKDSFAVLRGSWVRSCLRPGCAGIR